MLLWLPSEPATFVPQHYRQPSSDTYHPSHLSSLPTSPLHSLMPTTVPRNPTVRLHQSTPSPTAQSPNNSQSMLTQSAFVGSGWGNDSFPGAGYLNANAIPRGFKRGAYHKRKSSGSSVTSAGPPSPLDHTTAYPQIATSDLSHLSPSFDHFEYASPHAVHTPKSLPTPVGTPTSNSFMASQYPRNGAQDATGYPQNMRRLQTTAPDDEVSYAFSAPQSVSSMSHNSPATPHTNYEVEYDDQKNLYAGKDELTGSQMEGGLHFDTGYQSAAFNQAMQDVFPDQMYSSSSAYPAQAQQAVPRYNSHLSPHRSMFANRLQAANHDHLTARTSSPATSVPRDQSPFRQNSPFVEQARMGGQRSSQQMNSVPVSQAPEPTKSVSPKELMLDEHDIDDQSTPLFQGQSNSVFSNQRPSSNMSNFQSGLYNNHYSQNPSIQIPQQYPFVGQNRQESRHQSMSDRTPDFPAHLASMESTVEEGPSETSSQLQLHIQQSHSIQRPEDTSSDAGTYTCTYHGCTQRFETPAQLQKHKREGHRQISPASAPTAQSIALRNSQAGPHKCERINPSTGKPCNSIFSRPYDLTRHEDTIHNARKQKVRCHLCTEEKTFSRNDALTRHMRVVHPDIDWPGKTRRKNGRD
jgi:hypothetical protein